MAWARIDDAFDDHEKVLALLDVDGGMAAVGLWTLCLTWANRNTRKKGKTPGLIPSTLPRRFAGADGKAWAELLVEVGLWDEADSGWMIHDFADYLPGDETRAARSEAGKRGAAKRWADKHAAEAKANDGNLPSSDSKLPSASQDDAGNAVATDGSRAGAHRVTPYGVTPTPIPEPTPNPENPPSEAPPHDQDSGNREDVERVCEHLADRIEANGSKRPRTTKAWRESARLLMDVDGRSERQVHNMIDWCQNNEWWRSRVMSMSKLRDKYDAMRLQAIPPQGSGTPKGSNFAPNSGARSHTPTAEELADMEIEV